MYSNVCGAGPAKSATEKYLWDYNYNNYGATGIFFRARGLLKYNFIYNFKKLSTLGSLSF